jgi:hypothetical protein
VSAPGVVPGTLDPAAAAGYPARSCTSLRQPDLSGRTRPWSGGADREFGRFRTDDLAVAARNLVCAGSSTHGDIPCSGLDGRQGTNTPQNTRVRPPASHYSYCMISRIRGDFTGFRSDTLKPHERPFTGMLGRHPRSASGRGGDTHRACAVGAWTGTSCRSTRSCSPAQVPV